MSFKLLNAFCFLFFNGILTVMKNVPSGLKTFFDCKFMWFFCQRKACANCMRKEGIWRGYDVYIQVLWVLDHRDRLQEQPTCPESMEANSILGPLFSIFISAHG